MFTGIITDVTPIKRKGSTNDGLLLTFAKPTAWKDLKLGESIATDGACLTVSAIRDNEYDCLLMPETLSKTTFGKAVPESVNLERALAAGDRFGGHFVQGHVDCVGSVVKIDTADGHTLFVSFAVQYQDLVVVKGSIAVNGVSLTVADVDGHTLSAGLIPHTLQNTTLGTLKVGDQVNLEFDIIGKYAANMVRER